MSFETILIAVLGIIGSGVAAWLAARAELKRVPSQNFLDQTTARKEAADAVTLYEAAAASSAKREDELRTKLTACERRIDELEARLVGPFRILAEFTVNPLRITRTDLQPLEPNEATK